MLISLSARMEYTREVTQVPTCHGPWVGNGKEETKLHPALVGGFPEDTKSKRRRGTWPEGHEERTEQRNALTKARGISGLVPRTACRSRHTKLPFLYIKILAISYASTSYNSWHVDSMHTNVLCFVLLEV